jgi:hypothetical protein
LDKLLASINMCIGRHGIMVGIYEGRIKRLEARVGGNDEEDVAEARMELSKTRGLLDEANEDLEKFYEKVKKEWGPAQAAHHRLHPLLPRHRLQRWSRRLY